MSSTRSPRPPRAATRPGAPPGRVRIIGGRFRRTPIAVLDVPGLRPTPDRVRETLFNWLEHLLGDLADARVLDLFAGSGALGFEMASRGAPEVVLVESNAKAAAALRALQARLGADGVQVLQADWEAAVARLAPASFDVIFLDPPFESELLARSIGAVRGLLRRGGLLYAEGAKPLAPDHLDEWGLAPVRNGHAGVVYFQLLRARPC